ncbi:MAG: DUF547 domain-containing protein [Oligoflexales bacterium]
MGRLFFLLLMYSLINPSASAFDHKHQTWNLVLQNYVNSNSFVDYSGLKQDQDKLKNYLGQLESISKEEFNSWTSNERKAFLINAYNAFTIKLILDHYPINSIKDIGNIFTSPWKKKFFKLLDGRIKTLDQIEHDELRNMFEDYRIHAAVNCASNSCPPLRSKAFTAMDLDEQLDEQMQLWLADRSRNIFAPASNEIKLSMIFKWYRSDFETWGEGLNTVILRYGPPEAASLLANSANLSHLSYDWQLNDAK